MRIYHIKDSYIFNKKNKTGSHRYAVFFDRKSRETKIVALTSLYQYQNNKIRRLNNGYIKEYKLSCYKLPSGVETGFRTKDINGNAITLNFSNSRPSYNLSKKDSKKILSIAKKKIN